MAEKKQAFAYNDIQPQAR